MKDAINYFIPILKDPMNDITGRCMTNNALESAYCGSYHPMPAAKVINQPDMPMETNNMGMEIQYNNLIEIDDCQESQATPFAYQSSQPQRLQQNRKRNNYDCDIDSIANVKRCRREDAGNSSSRFTCLVRISLRKRATSHQESISITPLDQPVIDSMPHSFLELHVRWLFFYLH